jgi:hypothetical protein
LKDEALDHTIWRTYFGRGYGHFVSQWKCSVWLFSAVSWRPASYVYSSDTLWIILRRFQLSLLLLYHFWFYMLHTLLLFALLLLRLHINKYSLNWIVLLLLLLHVTRRTPLDNCFPTFRRNKLSYLLRVILLESLDLWRREHYILPKHQNMRCHSVVIDMKCFT